MNIKYIKNSLLIVTTIILVACGSTESVTGKIKPAGLKVESTVEGVVELSWNKVGEASSYIIYWGETDKVTRSNYLGQKIVTSETAKIENLEVLKKYYFVFSFVRNNEESDSSEVAVAATPVFTVESHGKTWLDRNLGATQACTATNDENCYGDFYQWGRKADGHEKCTVSNADVSGTDSCNPGSVTVATQSTSATPNHGNFITDFSDWLFAKQDLLWSANGGENNPCPNEFRLPTKSELETESAAWDSQDSAGAFASNLKLPMLGYRSANDSASAIYHVGDEGYYWTATASTSGRSFYAKITASLIDVAGVAERSRGHSVRCIKQ